MPRPAIVISARVVAGVVGIAVAVAAIAVAGVVSLPSVVRVPPSVSVTPVPSAKQLVCPGSVLQLGNSGGQNASVASALGEPTAATSGDATSVSMTASDAENGTAGSPILLTAPASSAGASLAGAQYQVVDAGDYRGLAAAECAQPSSDTWLLGGSTAVGRSTLLTMVNPGRVGSTVAIDLYSDEGLVEAAGTTGIVVPAGGQRVISLAGFAPDAASLAVHVVSRGGPIATNLQESIVRGIEPSGVDIIGRTAAPSTVNVIPGVLIVGAEALSGRLGEEGFDDLGTALRLFVPGDAAAQATVRVVPEDATLTGASFELSLDPGAVTDIPIEGLADGAYSVEVESSVAIAAAVRASTVAEEADGPTPAGASDVAWFGSATALTGSTIASIAPGPEASLHLSNPGDTAVTVTIGSNAVTVDAGATVTVEVIGGASYRFEGGAGLYASISVTAPGGLASYLVSSSANDETPVTIYPQP